MLKNVCLECFRKLEVLSSAADEIASKTGNEVRVNAFVKYIFFSFP